MPKTASGYFCQFQTVQTASRFGFAHIMEAKFFFAALVLNALSPISGFNQGKENPTVKTIYDDIAHLTCSASGNRLPSVKWERDGKELTDESLGIVIISWDNGTQVNSHLIIAVNGDERWGKYTCVVSSDGKETRETFVIERGEKGNGDKKLKSVDLIAIGVGFGITLCLSLMILYYMIQGIRRRKRENPDGEKSVNGEVNSGIDGDTAL